jgi:hypothetical protein
MSPIVSCYLLGLFNGCRRLPHGVFVDDPIATANNAWDIAVGDRPESVVGSNGNGIYDVPYPEVGLQGDSGGS